MDRGMAVWLRVAPLLAALLSSPQYLHQEAVAVVELKIAVQMTLMLRQPSEEAVAVLVPRTVALV
jgi:hypothetical protein